MEQIEINTKLAELMGYGLENGEILCRIRGTNLAEGTTWAPHSDLTQALMVTKAICEKEKCKFNFEIDCEESPKQQMYWARFFFEREPSFTAGLSDSGIGAIYQALCNYVEKGDPE